MFEMTHTRTFRLLALLVVCFMAVPAAADVPEEILRALEPDGRPFTKVEIGDAAVYFHQRTLGSAVVEKDFIVYRFDRNNGALLGRDAHWRDDLPEQIVPVVPMARAESMVEGDVLSTRLYLISPDSDVFPLDPAPENPCWVVRSMRDGVLVISVIDAITGRHLGYGVPPPQSTGYSLSGAPYAEPCQGAWTSWYAHAASWFEYMGYPTATAEWPDQSEIRAQVQSLDTAVFYEIGHSHGTWGLLFCSSCPDGYYCQDTTSEDIENWITGYPKMPFTFLASCYGMCDVGPGTLSHAFRRGSDTDTATVGYCNMSEDYCYDCWIYSLEWQEAFFAGVAAGDSIKEALDQALLDYPMCAPIEGSCMRFAGDESFAIVPVVARNTCGSVPVSPGPPLGEAGYQDVRYLSLEPGSPGAQTALRVTLVDLPAPFGAYEGLQMWVGPPVEKCENAGQADVPAGGCAPVPTMPSDTVLTANLQCTPHCMDFGALPQTLHVTDDEIVPGGTYAVQAVDCGCYLGAEVNYSASLPVTTSAWGDLVGNCTTVPCTPPNGTVDVTTDVTACLDKFKNLPGSPAKIRADVEPDVADWLVNITDVTCILDAFRGLPYPFDGPGGCP
jgi:hypothetical protein